MIFPRDGEDIAFLVLKLSKIILEVLHFFTKILKKFGLNFDNLKLPPVINLCFVRFSFLMIALASIM